MFSTILNFGVLGFLQRLHRIHVQYCLESESKSTKIVYPHREVHKKKEGNQDSNSQEIRLLSNHEILESIQSAKKVAKNAIKSLGMHVLLQQHKKYDNPPLPVFCGKSATHDDIKDEDEDGDDTKGLDPCLAGNIPEDTEDMATDISVLKSNGIIDNSIQKHFNEAKHVMLKQIPNTSLPLFDVATNTTAYNEKPAKLTMINRSGHSVFVRIQYGDKMVYVRKTTIVWLLQEGERVSADRLFRVRAKQPYAVSTTQAMNNAQNATSDPTVSETISVGNICACFQVFSNSMEDWKNLKLCLLFRKV